MIPAILLLLFLFFIGNLYEKPKETTPPSTSKKENIEEMDTKIEIDSTRERIPIQYVPVYEHQVHAYCDQCKADITGNVQAHLYYSKANGGNCTSVHYEEIDIYVGDEPIYLD